MQKRKATIVRQLTGGVAGLMKAAKIISKGKMVTINLNLEKPIAQQMIDRQLKEFQAKKLKEKDKTFAAFFWRQS